MYNQIKHNSLDKFGCRFSCSAVVVENNSSSSMNPTILNGDNNNSSSCASGIPINVLRQYTLDLPLPKIYKNLPLNRVFTIDQDTTNNNNNNNKNNNNRGNDNKPADPSTSSSNSSTGSAPTTTQQSGRDAYNMTPQQMINELNRFVIGQAAAKKAVAIAWRARWRRRKMSSSFKSEVTPKNILMVGPTGCGKTEVARRLAKISDAPFVKVEATKYTEVGYVGKDVSTIIEDLVAHAATLVKEKKEKRWQQS